jgi:hypothetical protein
MRSDASLQKLKGHYGRLRQRSSHFAEMKSHRSKRRPFETCFPGEPVGAGCCGSVVAPPHPLRRCINDSTQIAINQRPLTGFASFLGAPFASGDAEVEARSMPWSDVRGSLENSGVE